jgi:PAS domain S-box-containing protein
MLHQSEDRYRTIFETTGTATVIIDEDTTISLANTEFEKLSGYSKTEIEGRKSWTEFVAEEHDLQRMKAYHELRRVNADAAPRSYEYRFVDRKGEIRRVFATIGMISSTGKSVGSFLDVTEHKRAEEGLRESERRFRDLVENSPTGIAIIQDNRLVYQNPEHQRLLEPLPEGFRVPDFEILHPDDTERLKDNYHKIASGEAQSAETDFRFYPFGRKASKADMRWVHWRASVTEYQGKKALLVNMVDMTRAKELEQLLRIQDKMGSPSGESLQGLLMR